ncbi:2-methylisocitrate lyase-like PEP mutase family enzyme [Luteimonas cucumeris]|uniref:2-methylisocitrate lyase-like PEP mutase family enzyme n=1 Tax=Luteimonas cucumeris TaxID=985012 RepID=A0A562L8G5_9GAMM|nr:isocitrate lyase/phosphoenolpyruvate mutase family protein [Luteimonas cucumeris]TWI03911.1 2-methylisocitrate lyase-like PEP mutase family enzyme [Luteimonas cucumeris]
MSELDPAAAFRELHSHGMLLLANVWDAGSARLVESLGAKAIATTSAGVAWSLGYRDGDALPIEKLIDAVASMSRVLHVPLTVDSESGYSDNPAIVADNIARLIDAGAVGINLEDGSDDPALLCAKLEQIKRSSARMGVNLFINARTDVFLAGLAPEPRRVEETLARAQRYRDAGADGLFVPGLTDRNEIRAIAEGTALPLNIMARPTLPPAAELEGLGVRRLSAGSAIAESIFARAATLAGGFLGNGASAPLSEQAMRYPDINALFAAR